MAEAFGGGLLEVVRAIAETSAASGHRAAIAFGRRPETPHDPREVVAEPVELFDLDWRRGSLASHAGAAARLQRIMRRWKPDVVHLHSSYAGAFGTLVCRIPVPVVFTPHAWASTLAAPSRRPLYAAVERLITRRVDVIGAVSNSEASVARRLRPCAAVAVVPNGIPELDSAPLGFVTSRPPAKRPLVVAMGRIVQQRQPHESARILAAVSDIADVEWIGGGGDDGPAGDAARRALQAAGVRLTGWLPRSEATQRLGEATAYLHWSAWDGLSLSVVEAMAHGTFVVASNIEPNRELLSPAQVASDPSEAVALLRRALVDERFRAEHVADQAARVLGRSARDMADRWVDVYRQLAAAGRPGGDPAWRDTRARRPPQPSVGYRSSSS